MSKQVVFIDSRAPDITDLINGVLPDEQVFVLDPAQDGLDQIAAILRANDLTGLSAISIVGHGAPGEIDLGSTVIDDASLPGEAAALSAIGASLAPGGNLSLFACDTAAGATGQQFIADLSKFAGGVDVAAATHLVGSADLGGSWTLDASTDPAAAPANVPFTNQALASFHGTLATLAVTAGATTIYHGGDAAQPLDATLTVTDFSSAQLVGASVQIVTFASGDTLNFTDQNNIHGSYNVNTGLLTLSGNDTAADYQAALRSVTYSFAGNGDPTAGGHQQTYVSWQVSDGNAADVAPAPINNDQPTLGLNQLVMLNGTFPANDGNFGTTDGGGIPLGAIRTFAGDFAWGGTAAADGQILSIQQNTPLFAVLGPNYGGNGTTNFGLPNLQARLAVGFEQNSSSGAFLGQAAGSDTVTLTKANLPTNWGGADLPFNNDQPSLGLNYIINTAGAVPGTSLSDDLAGEVVPFLGQYAPAGYLFANGQLLPISQYSNLYSVIGTTYGGDGTNTFALPDLTGKTIIGAGTSLLSGTQVGIGATPGQDSTPLVSSNLPVPLGGSIPISNQQPSLALTYLISPFGIFPSSSGAPLANQPEIGEIIAFAGTGTALNNMLDAGWMLANGTTLGISQYEPLFSVIGTTYGGNGVNDFVLPDLVGRSVAGVGSSNGVSVSIGQNSGNANITLASNQVPLTTSTLDIVHTGPTVVAGATLAFAAGDAAAPLDSALTVSDPDSGGNLTGATIRIGSGFVAGDTLHFVNQNGISGSYVAGTGILTLTGNDTLAHYQTALESIGFSTTDGNPGSRTIDWSVTDGAASNGTSATATSTVNLAPTIGSVTAATTGNATDLDAGKVVTITVNFTGPVNVTGAPELQLSDNEVATYVSGSGGSALTFKYIVQPSDTTADLQVQSLLTNGGTIKDGSGNDAGLANAATDLHLQIDTTAPTASSIAAAGSSPNAGGNEQFTVTFSESVTGVDSSDFTAVTNGTTDTGIAVTPVSGSVYTVTVDGVSGNGTLGLDLKASGTGIADLAGNAISGGFTGGSYTIAGPPLDSVMTHPTLTLTLDRGVDPSNAVYTAQSVVGTVGGGSAVEWLDPAANTDAGVIEFLSPTGAVTANVSLSASTFSQLPTGGGQLAALSNGDVALAYSGTNGNTYFSVIGSGGVVVGETLVTSGSIAGTPTQLSNGDIAITSVVGSTLEINLYSTQAGSFGHAVGTPLQISNALLFGSQAIAGNDNGNFAVIYNSTSDNQAHVAFYANAGTSPTATVALGASQLAETVALSNGDFAVLTSDNSYANFSLKIYTPTGSEVGNAVSLPNINGDIFLAADLTPGEQGVTVYNDFNTSVSANGGSIFAIRFDNAGNIVAGGTQSSQGNITSIENSGNGVEVYNGHGQYFVAGAAQGFSAGEVNLYLNQFNSSSAPVLQTFELTAPTVTSVAALGSSPNNAGSEQFTVTFSESVTGVVAGDFTLTTTNTPGGTALSTGGITSITGSGTTYTVTVGGVTGDGTLRLDLKSNSTGITDASGIGATAGFTGGDVYTIEHTPPGVSSIIAASASPNNAASDQFLVTFSEGVTGVDASDFTATVGGTATDTGISLTPLSASAYLVTVGGVAGDGTLRLDLKSSGTGITDAAGNAVAGGFTGGNVYTVDHTPPSASSIATNGASPNNATAETFIVTFSENVTGVTSADFTAATTGSVTDTGITVTPVSGSVYTVTVNGVTGDGTLGLNLNASGTGIADAAGNAISGGATGQVYTIEHTPPAVSSVTAPTNGTYGPGGVLTFTANFSENVLVTTGGGTPYIAVTLDTGGTVHAAYAGGSGTSQLTFTYTVVNGNDDTNGVTVGSSIVLNGGTIKDAATNAAVLTLNNVASTAGVLVDAIPPTVTAIDTVDGNPNNLSAEHFTVTFSTPVNGVDASDFTLVGTGTASGTIGTVSGSGTNWTVTVNSVTGDGTLRLDLNNTGHAITDNFGNTLTAAHTGDQSYTIEHTPPAVTSVTVPADSTYIAGQNLDFTATFSEAVTVTGTPRIAVTLDTGGTVYADYVAGSGTNTLIFRDTVAPGQQDLTGITTATAIDLNGGVIKDVAGNAAGGAGLNLIGEPSTAAINVDAILPAVTSVGVPVNGTYGTAQDLDFSVNFSKAVTVNTGGGVPFIQLTLDTGGIVDATYLSGSGTSALVFRYVVPSGELDTNGITVGSSLVLNGATVQDAIGNNAATALNNVGSTTGVLVDSIPPTVTSINTVDASPNNLATEHFTVTFSTAVTGVDASDFTLVGTGTASGAINTVSGSGTTWTVTLNNVTGDGTLRLDLNPSGSTITDAFGNVLTAAHTGDQSYTIDHTAPGAPAVVLAHDTGTSNTDGITSDPTITITPAESGGTLLYKIDGATSFSATAPNFATNGSADGPHTVSVEQEDAAGNFSAPTMLSFTFDTTAPAAPTNAVSLAHATGVAGTHNLTNDPTIVYGTPAAGDHFLFELDNGGFSATVPPPLATDHSADGLHTISVEEVDTAGNISAPEVLGFKLDTIAPQITAVTASPAGGLVSVGQTVAITVAFGEAVTVVGGTPTLSLNDHGTATYDAAATAALHDPGKLVFDYTVAVSDTITSPLAVSGISLHGAVIEDLAANAANLGNIATTFTGLGIDSSLITANPDSNHVLAGQTVTADAAHGVLANDTDSNPADHLVVSAVDGLAADVNQPVAGAYGSLTMHADGSYSYSASSAVSGVVFDNFTYTAGNGHSPASTSTLTVEVVGANQNFVFVPSGGSATGGYGNTVLDGSAGNATLTAATTFNAHQILVGGPGDVLNAASFGQDTFVFANNFGHETINNFHPALDVIQLQQSQFGSLANVLADIHQVGADSVLTLDANHVITITNTSHSSLTAADFHLV